LGRLLAELGGGEFNDLRTVVDAVSKLDLPEPYIELHAIGRQGSEEIDITVVRRGERKAEGGNRIAVCQIANWRELFALLKGNQLASDGASGFYGSFAGPGVIIIHRDVVERIRGMIGDSGK